MSTRVFEILLRENIFNYLWVSAVFYKHVPQLYINMLVIGLIHGPCLMVISVMGILLMQNYLPFIMCYWNTLLLFAHKLHCLQTF